LKDKSGISRQNNHFKLTDGPFEESYKFAIKTDEVKPDISSITAQTNENSGLNGDSVKVQYSERMIIYTKTRTIAGGGDDISGSEQKAPAGYPGSPTNSTNRNAAKNYTLTFTPVGGTSTSYVGTWFNIGGQAVYDTNDPTHKTVILLPPRFTGLNSGQVIPSSVSTSQGFAKTSDAAAAITQDGNDNTFQLTVAYLKSDGTVTTASATADIDTAAAKTATEFASSLQVALNTHYSVTVGAGSPWTVTQSADGKALSYFFNASGAVSAAITGRNTAEGAGDVRPSTTWTPSTGATGIVNYTVAANGFVDIYKAGDTIRVVATSSILDPAGNTLNTSRDNASGNAS